MPYIQLFPEWKGGKTELIPENHSLLRNGSIRSLYLFTKLPELYWIFLFHHSQDKDNKKPCRKLSGKVKPTKYEKKDSLPYRLLNVIGFEILYGK